MDFNNFKKKLEDIIKQKNISALIIILLVVIMIYFVVSYFTDVNNISNSVATMNTEDGSNDISNGGETAVTSEYEKEQEESLRNILKQIDGVGNVDVKIHFEGSEVKVPAVDNNTQKSTTEETDGDGGKRVNEQETEGGKVVMSSSGSGNEPFILETIKPKISGVVVVAEGADNSKIKYEITKAVSSLYNISLEKVNVFSMKK